MLGRSYRCQIEPDIVKRMLQGGRVHAVRQLSEDSVHVLHGDAEHQHFPALS